MSSAASMRMTKASGQRVVARDGETHEQRHVDRVDDQRQRQHDELAAARAVLDEDVLEDPGRDRSLNNC